MKRLALIVLAILMVFGFSPLYCAENKPEVTIEGMRIVTKGYTGQDRFRAFMWSEGTTLSLMLFLPEGGIVDFRKDESKIESVTDDKGTDLTKTDKKDSYVFSGFDFFPKKSDDTKAMLIEIVSPGFPKKGATSIKVKGTLVASVGTKTEVFETKGLPIKVGEKIKTGGESLEIEKIAKGSGDHEYSFSLKGKGVMGAIKEIKLFDDSDEEIEMSNPSCSFYGNNFTLNYQVKKKIETGTFRVEYWTDLKDLEVPFDIETGVGIGK